jgi:hypothetical protein
MATPPPTTTSLVYSYGDPYHLSTTLQSLVATMQLLLTISKELKTNFAVSYTTNLISHLTISYSSFEKIHLVYQDETKLTPSSHCTPIYDVYALRDELVKSY